MYKITKNHNIDTIFFKVVAFFYIFSLIKKNISLKKINKSKKKSPKSKKK